MALFSFLFRVEFRLMARNRAAFFWSLVFPICVSFLAFMVLDPSSAFFGNVKVFVSDQDDTEFSRTYIKNIEQFSKFVDAVRFEFIDLNGEDTSALDLDPESIVLTIHEGHSEAIYSENTSQIVIEVGEFDRVKSSAVAGILLSLDATSTAAVLNGLTSNISAKVVGVDYSDAKFGTHLTAQLIVISVFPVFIYGVFVVSVGHRESGIIRSILLYPAHKMIPILAIVCSRVSYSILIILALSIYFLLLFEISFLSSFGSALQVAIVALTFCSFFGLISLFLAIVVDKVQLSILIANSIYLIMLFLSGLIPIPIENNFIEYVELINPISASVDLLILARDGSIFNYDATIKFLNLFLWSVLFGYLVFQFRDRFFQKSK